MWKREAARYLPSEQVRYLRLLVNTHPPHLTMQYYLKSKVTSWVTLPLDFSFESDC
jgi:hypothetical protein